MNLKEIMRRRQRIHEINKRLQKLQGNGKFSQEWSNLVKEKEELLKEWNTR